MGTIFMNSENSKTSQPCRLLLNLSDTINLKRSDKYVAISNFTIYYAWKKRTCKSSEFKMSAQKWNGKYELPDGLDYVSDIQDYFEYNHQKT